jgi:hypothetical protein
MATPTVHQSSSEAPILARAHESGPVAEDGLHLAVCVDVIDQGMKETPWGAKHKIRIVWQLDLEGPDGRRFVVSRVYTNSLGQKAMLRRDLESWRGKAFTAEELAGFDLLKLLGANCQVQTVAAEREAATYANVQAIVPPPRGVGRLQPLNYVREKDRAPRPGFGGAR